MSLAEPPASTTLFNVDAGRPHVSASLDRLLAALVDHLRERRGIVVLSGESGSGKSTALRQLAIDAAPGIAAAVVQATPQTKARELYEALLPSLGEKPDDGDAPGFHVRAALARAEIPYPALLVDDAEHLSPSAFAALVELAAPGEGYLSVTVVLATSLAPSALLRGRTMIAASSGAFTMPPLSRREVEHFVRAHLRRAQLPPDAFAIPVLEEISRRSAGNPRAVARIAGGALERAVRAGRINVILDDLRGAAGAEKPAIPETAPSPPRPSEVAIEQALRAIGAAASNQPPAPPDSAASTDPLRVVIPATPGARPAAALPQVSGSKPALAPPATPPMPRSVWAVTAGLALVSASALGFLALTYSDGIRDRLLERLAGLREMASFRLATTERAPATEHVSASGAADMQAFGSSRPENPATAEARAESEPPPTPVAAAPPEEIPPRPAAAAASAVPEPPAPAAAPGLAATVSTLAAAPAAVFVKESSAAEPSAVPEPPAPVAAPIAPPPATTLAAAPEAAPSETSAAAEPSAVTEPSVPVDAPSDAPAPATVAAAAPAPIAPKEPATAEASAAPEPSVPVDAPADTPASAALAAAPAPIESEEPTAAAEPSAAPEPPAPAITPADAQLAAAPAAIPSERSAVEPVSAVTDPAAVQIEAALPPLPAEVDPDRLPPPVVADLGPARPIAPAAGTEVPPTEAPVAATSGTSRAAAVPAVGAPAPRAAPDADLTRFFAEAEAAIRQQAARPSAAASSAAPDDISPELRRTFEAFWRSLQPPAASDPEPDAATRALFERFMAERAQRPAGRSR